jgi:hypothetical protein
MLYRIEKRLPDLLRLFGTQPGRGHLDDERVVGIYMYLLAPMFVEEIVAVEAHEIAQQTAVRIIG